MHSKTSGLQRIIERIAPFCLEEAQKLFAYGPRLRVVDIVDVFDLGGESRHCWRHVLARPRGATPGQMAFEVVQESEPVNVDDIWRNFPL